MELNDNETLKYIQEKISRDYNELSDEYKYLIEDKYKRIINETNINNLL